MQSALVGGVNESVVLGRRNFLCVFVLRQQLPSARLLNCCPLSIDAIRCDNTKSSSALIQRLGMLHALMVKVASNIRLSMLFQE